MVLSWRWRTLHQQYLSKFYLLFTIKLLICLSNGVNINNKMLSLMVHAVFEANDYCNNCCIIAGYVFFWCSVSGVFFIVSKFVRSWYFSHVVKERCMYVEPCAPEHTYISLVLSISISTVTVIYVPHSVSVFHNVFFIKMCVNWLFTTLYMQKDSIIVYIVCRGNSKRF